MDDSLSKLLSLQELAPKPRKWLTLPSEALDLPEITPESIASNVTPTSDSCTFDIWNSSILSQLVGNNHGLHRRLLEKFLIKAHQQVTSIEAAALVGDAHKAGDLAHTLKSAARSVGALALGELCQQIETAGQADDGPACTALTRGLTEALAGAQLAIRQYCQP